MATMRTIKQAIAEIKAADPNTSFTERALRTLTNNGSIPFVKVGNKKLVNMEVLYKYLNGEFGSQNKLENTFTGIRPIY